MAQQQFLRNGRWVPFAEMKRIRAKEIEAMKNTGIDPKKVVAEAKVAKEEPKVAKPKEAPKEKAVKTKGKK